MVEEVRLPEISENVDTGTVIGVLVSAGDSVAKEDPLVELETEKAAFEVPAPFGGTVTDILVGEGDEVKVGQVIVKLEVGEEKEEAAGSKEAEDEEGEEGGKERRAKEEPVRKGQERDEVREKGEEGRGEEQESKGKEEDKPQKEEKPEEKPSAKEEKARGAGEEEPRRDYAPASPSVRRLAREIGVDIDRVRGSGPGGRISADDVKAHAKQTAAGAGEQELPDFTAWGEVSREPMSGVRKATARSVAAAWRHIPHVTQYDRTDITELEDFRKDYARSARDAGGKLTVTAILLKVTAAALQAFPQFNASLDTAKQEIVYKHFIHIGVAVDTDRGLLVPVIREVDRKSIIEISVELTAMAEKARNRKIRPEEMKGGTFTLSNLGGIGGTGFAPVVFWPQVAILGVSRASTEAVYNDGRFEPRLILPLSLSYDHRVIDGAAGTRFLRWVCEALEKPLLLLLQGGR
jgi:pyruvate dehydrogenase E2 component (dihydrolipoamide acetyltransferase)